MKGSGFLKFLGSLFVITALVLSGCVSKKKKGEVSKLGKMYHNVTSKYNGYFNANELYNNSITTLQASNEDNYSKIIELYDYISVPDPKMVNSDMDKAIEKVAKVAAIHDKGDWVDDCYVLMGKAQYMKQDYEKAEETFAFFEEEFNPANPSGRNFLKKKPSAKAKKKEVEENKKIKAKALKEKKETDEKAREEKQKSIEEERKNKAEAAEKAKKERAEVLKNAKKEKELSREEQRKETIKQREQAKKDRAKGIKTAPKPKSKREVGSDPKNTNPTSAETKVEEEKIETKPEVKKVDELDKDEPETSKPADKEKKKSEDKTSYNEGLFWLARTYIRNENYSAAEFALKQLEEISGLKKDIDKLVPVAFAELYIKQKDYQTAVPYLKTSIKKASSKNNRARYAFVLGQIMANEKDYKGAQEYFGLAQKNAKDFKLKFMSILSLAKMEASSGTKTPKEVIASLSKYLKETKYKNFKDQIYYSMGEVAMNVNNFEAKGYFVKSSIENQENKSLKAEACYKIANLEMDVKNYASAKAYFDTTFTNLNTFDERYFEVKNLAANLGPIAANIELLIKNDSLLALGNLSEKALKKLIKEKGVKTDKAIIEEGAKITKSSVFESKSVANVNSNFFAYNQATKELGKTTFKILWGQRKLEDNWRRSSKAFQANDVVQANENNAVATETGNEEMSDVEFKKAIGEVPINIAQKENLKTKNRNALVALGRDYREKLQEYRLSADALEKLLSEFSNFPEESEAMYLLYRDYVDLKLNNKAEDIKSKITQKFPNDKYSKIVNDPNFLNELANDAKALEKAYESCLALFGKSDYTSALSQSNSTIEKFGKENKLMPKFSLLNAMCLGAIQGKEIYIKSLQELVVRYPKTPEETKAKEILRFLNGDGTAFKGSNVKDVDNIFTTDDDARHYIAIIVMSSDADPIDKAEIVVAGYNTTYHNTDNLVLAKAGLSIDESTQLILIRSFDNKKHAMKYYEGVKKSTDQYITNVSYEMFAISQTNYRKMLAQKTHSNYQAFFESTYLKK
jgi:tetratricopeptide (TPR) repeat protein